MGLHGSGWTDHVPDCLHDGHGHRKPGGMALFFSVLLMWMAVLSLLNFRESF